MTRIPSELPDAPDWDAVAAESVEEFRTLLRFESVNPPGNETEAAQWVSERLSDEGIESTTRWSEDRPNVVARLKGDGTGGGPLLLTGHLDVVPVERDYWRCDPFAAEIHDGYIYGRGAIDMKNMVAMSLTVIRLLKRTGARLTRDVIFAAVSDEEEGCTHGSRFLVEQFPEDVRAEYMLGEIGGFPLDIQGVRFYPIQIAEKGTCQFRMTAEGQPGHGSMPRSDSAIHQLAEAIDKLGKTRLPQHNTRSVATNLRVLSENVPPPARWVLPLLLKPALAGKILDHVIPDEALKRTLAANLSNTVAVTGLEADSKINVIPGKASARLDGRLIPGQTSADLLREVRDVVGEGLSFEIIRDAPGREETPDDPLYDAICENIRRHDPTGIPLPYMVPGFTDARYFGRLGTKCYGYSPVFFPPEDGIVFSELFHGHNERIPVDGYTWGLRALWDLVRRFATQ